MTFAFSQDSLDKLAAADPVFTTVFSGVANWFNCTILNSIRTEAEEAADVAKGLSKTMHSKHLPDPVTGKSDAVDAAPYPQRWGDKGWDLDLVYFGGFVHGYAAALFDQGVITTKLRYGGDWNRNNEVSDETFIDRDHFEKDP